MAEQLPLDFTVSATQRHRRAVKHNDEVAQLDLFASWTWSPNIDIHLDGPDEAVASIAGKDPDRAHDWLSGMVGGNITVHKPRKLAFPVAFLDRFLHLRPPAQVTLDAASTAVARALWARKLGLRPVRVVKDGRRLTGTTKRRWPTGFSMTDIPWNAIHACVHLDLDLEVDDNAKNLFAKKLTLAGTKIATSGIAGSAVTITTSRPDLVERLNLPGLAFDGIRNSGQYRLPILTAEPLLRQDVIEVPATVADAIRKATRPIRPLTGLPDDFPWQLYDFQAADAGRALRILETTGGVLLAGDMGSGKTTVSLAITEHLDLFPLLVVAPLSAFSTWARQLKEMNRNYYMATESPAKSWDAIENNEHDAVIISFDRINAFIELIERKNFKSVIADEVQRIRTPGSKRSRAIRQIAGSIPYRMGLSGTPLTNTVADVLPLGAFLVPGEWKPRANEKDLEDLYPGGEPTESLAEHLGSIMVRRRIDQVGKPMPKRNDHRIYIQLTPEQRGALADLEAEAEAAKAEGAFDDNSGRMHAFARLQKMRQIINSPAAAGVKGPNPKVNAAIEMAKEFLDKGRKGVIFCADRTTFSDIGRRLDDEGVGWVGIWGSTPPADRIENERMFHAGDPAPNGNPTDVVVCTIQAGAESWSASPTGTWLITTAYVYAPSTLAQMSARVHRLNSALDGPEIEIMYIHATATSEKSSLDDRMVEILEVKKQLFAQVIDRQAHIDTTKVHYSMGDLVYLMTGERDEGKDARAKDAKAAEEREKARKLHAQKSLYKHKRNNADLLDDTGDVAMTLEEHRAQNAGPSIDEELDAMLEAADHFEDFDEERA